MVRVELGVLRNLGGAYFGEPGVAANNEGDNSGEACINQRHCGSDCTRTVGVMPRRCGEIALGVPIEAL